MGSEVDRIKNPWLAKMTLWLKSVFDLLIVRSVFNKIQFNPKIWCIYDFIYQRRAFFSSKPFLEKTKWFYFLCTSKLQFTSFDQTLFNLYEFQMVSDILGHPVQQPWTANLMKVKFSHICNCTFVFIIRNKPKLIKNNSDSKYRLYFVLWSLNRLF